MNGSTATFAVIRTRLGRDASFALACAGMCALVAYLQRFDERYAHLAGALAFTALAAIAAAFLLHSRRHRELTLCEGAAPLYGRELARARAIVPCAIATAAAAAYWGVSAVYAAPPAADVVLTLACAYAAAALALCAVVANAKRRTAYLAGACALCGISFACAAYPAAALAADAIAAYAALRQYGEALTRSAML